LGDTRSAEEMQQFIIGLESTVTDRKTIYNE